MIQLIHKTLLLIYMTLLDDFGDDQAVLHNNIDQAQVEMVENDPEGNHDLRVPDIDDQLPGMFYQI
jgi:hypothetical protein